MSLSVNFFNGTNLQTVTVDQERPTVADVFAAARYVLPQGFEVRMNGAVADLSSPLDLERSTKSQITTIQKVKGNEQAVREFVVG